MKFLEAVAKYRKTYGIPGGAAPKKGSDEYDAVMEVMGKPTAKGLAYNKKRDTKAASSDAKAAREEAKRVKDEPKALAKAMRALAKKAAKGELSEAYVKHLKAMQLI
jgi:hypothetical protein